MWAASRSWAAPFWRPSRDRDFSPLTVKSWTLPTSRMSLGMIFPWSLQTSWADTLASALRYPEQKTVTPTELWDNYECFELEGCGNLWQFYIESNLFLGIFSLNHSQSSASPCCSPLTLSSLPSSPPSPPILTVCQTLYLNISGLLFYLKLHRRDPIEMQNVGLQDWVGAASVSALKMLPEEGVWGQWT